MLNLIEYRISPNLRAVPNFHITGNPRPPEILSNRIVLTPPAPGNQRGSIWSESSLQHSVWTVDIDFRATGPERGGGNMQIWYVMDGQNTVGTSSIYTVGKFEGLALVIDQYAGSVRYPEFQCFKTAINITRADTSEGSWTTALSTTNPIIPSTAWLLVTAHIPTETLDAPLAFKSSKPPLP